MPQLLEPGHEIVCGTIGMGKSCWVPYKIVKSLMYNRPCGYIDPKGDTYRALLSFFADTHQGRELWEEHESRVLLVNPVATGDWMVGFNAIEPMGEFLYANPDLLAPLANSFVSHVPRQSGFEQHLEHLPFLVQ